MKGYHTKKVSTILEKRKLTQCDLTETVASEMLAWSFIMTHTYSIDYNHSIILQ